MAPLAANSTAVNAPCLRAKSPNPVRQTCRAFCEPTRYYSKRSSATHPALRHVHRSTAHHHKKRNCCCSAVPLETYACPEQSQVSLLARSRAQNRGAFKEFTRLREIQVQLRVCRLCTSSPPASAGFGERSAALKQPPARRGLTLRSSGVPTARRAGHQALGLRPILRLLSSASCRCRPLNSNVDMASLCQEGAPVPLQLQIL